MTIARLAAVAALTLTPFLFVSGAHAATMAECSAKYKAAQTAGTLNGMKWNDFRKAQCGADAPATQTAATPDAAEPTAANTENMAEPAAPTAVAPKGVAFPKAVDKKYASETPGKARMHTCLDQYKANKASNTLQGLTWIKKGGGFYSICNSKLKVAS